MDANDDDLERVARDVRSEDDPERAERDARSEESLDVAVSDGAKSTMLRNLERERRSEDDEDANQKRPRWQLVLQHGICPEG